MNRREFLAATSLAAGALAAGCATNATSSAPRFTPKSRVIGANDDVRVAIVGFNSRGKDHIDGFKKLKGVRLVALCDVDSQVLERGRSELAKDGITVETYTDVRKLLEHGEIDAISTATPNHWHSLLAIWACQAGKDVYVEKPVSHNVWEGRQIVAAARKYGRIVQTGTQSRSNPGLREPIAWLHEGNLGKIRVARGLCYKPRQSIGKVSAPSRIPDGIDYDLWCGPSPLSPLMREKLHYDWHWQFITGNGDLGNQGIHQMDIARWALGETTLSPKVFSVGGRFGYEDDGNTPNSQFVYHAYDRAPLIFEVRGLPKSKEYQDSRWNRNMPDYQGAQIGVVLDCDGGRMVIPSYDSAKAFDKSGREIKSWRGGADHYANFISAMRSRRTGDLNAEILEGHLSSGLCHTGNISYLLGKKLSPGAIREKLQDMPEASETFGRLSEHLAANGVDLNAKPAVLGEFLHMDVRNERFASNRRANEMLTREYRKGFEVPENV
jgi:predicted dehydrogenase